MPVFIRDRSDRRAAILARREQLFQQYCSTARSALAEERFDAARAAVEQAGLLKPEDVAVEELVAALDRRSGSRPTDRAIADTRRASQGSFDVRERRPSGRRAGPATRDARPPSSVVAPPASGPASWSAGTLFVGTPRRTTTRASSVVSCLAHCVAGVSMFVLAARNVPAPAAQAPPAMQPYQAITFVAPPPGGSVPAPRDDAREDDARDDAPQIESAPEEPPPEEVSAPAIPELDSPAPPDLQAVPLSLDGLAAAVLPDLPALSLRVPSQLDAAVPVLASTAPTSSAFARTAPSVAAGLALSPLLFPADGYWEFNEIDREPVLERYVRPDYPEEAREREVEGVVTVLVSISHTGRVERARIVRGVPLLNEAALDAARQFEFRPAIKRGFAVPVAMRIEIGFNLNALR